MLLAILKITRIQTAHKEAIMPISATKLFPVNKLSKSSRVMLKIISATAIVIKV